MENITINQANIKNLLRFTRSADKVRPSLGMPITAVQAARIGARFSPLGRAIILTAEKAGGKGDVIESTTNTTVAATLENSDYLSRRWLKGRLYPGGKADRSMSHISVTFEDLAMMADNEYHLKNTLNLLSWMTSNKKFTHKTKIEEIEGDGTDLAYEFDSISAICGATPRVMSRITRRIQWREMWVDRFSRFALLLRRQDLARIRKYEAKGDFIGSGELRDRIGRNVPKIPDSVEWEISNSDIIQLYRRLIGEQHNERRGLHYVRADLAGLAVLNRSPVTQDVLAFASLLAPYYQVGGLHARDAYITQLVVQGLNIKDISQRVGIRDRHYLLRRLRYLERRGFVGLVGGDPFKAKVRIGWQLELSLKSIDALLFGKSIRLT